MNLAIDVVLHAGRSAVDVALYTLLPMLALGLLCFCGVRDDGKADCNQRNPGTARLLPKGLLRYAGMRLACLRSSVGRRPAAVVTWGRRVLQQRRFNGWKSRKLPRRLASETDCHVQLKVS